MIETAKAAGINVIFTDTNDKVYTASDTLLSCLLDDKQIVFDYIDWDFVVYAEKYSNIPYFKSHHLNDGYSLDNTYAIGPVMLYPNSTIKQYLQTHDTFNYKCSNNIIKSKQIPSGNALKRRRDIQALLKNNFKGVDVNPYTPANEFWSDHENCLASVCVPGASNNILDRGQMELMCLGVCTISPNIPTKISWDKELIPDVHYLQCKDDYSDLINILKWCMENRERCEKIGNHAKELYSLYLTPTKYWEWIIKCTEEFYE